MIFKIIGRMAFMSLVLLSSCSTATKREIPTENPNEIYEVICSQGSRVEEVSGELWLKAKSKETSGQFPAFVKATAPHTLDLEATDLLGGTLAQIHVENDVYRIVMPGKKVKEKKGFATWAGLPLRWAGQLFLGSIPCAKEGEKVSVEWSSEGDLFAQLGSRETNTYEEFTYRIEKDLDGRPRVKSIHWKKEGKSIEALEMKIVFDDWEKETGAPLRWEAESEKGQIKVRWKERQVKVH